MRVSRVLCLFCVLLLAGCMILDEGPESGRRERRHGHGYAEPRYAPPPPPQDEPERGHSLRKYRKEPDTGREQGERGRRGHRVEAQKRKDAGPLTADNRTGALVIAILAVVFAAIAMAVRHRGRFMAIIGLALGVLGIIEFLPS